MKERNPTALFPFRNFLIIPKTLTAVFPNFLSTDSFLPSAAAVGRIACRIRPTAQNWKSPKIYTDKPRWAQEILRSYSRNLCTLAESNTIFGDVKSNFDIGQTAFFDYIQALEKLYIIEDIDAWCPAIRSKTAIRSSKKRNLIDPSIAVAAMGLSPQYFNTDFKTLGFLFESLCIRDLKIYSSAFDGDMCYYRDRYGLEADGVLRLNDGRYALIEFKLGAKQIEEGAKHLLEIERLIDQYNQKEKQCPLRLPDLKIVITGTEYGYRRPDGVFVIPIGCLKD